MTNSYKRKGLKPGLRQLGLAALLAGGTALGAQAQGFVYAPVGASNVAGTYTDLAATGTAIATANTDDANSAAQPIGFTFKYNGADFTEFVLNTNGLIRLGNAAPSVANLFANYEAGQLPGIDPVGSTDAADVNLLMPFNFDLETGPGGAEYRVVTTGTAPNQVCTIQWKNVRDKAGTTNAAQYDNFAFQLKLYQTSNKVEFVYAAATPATAGAETARFPTVGLKGSGSAAGQDVLANKATSGAAWSTTVFISGVYGTSTHNFRRTVGPDAGRTYRFVAVAPNDVAVQAVYALGKIATPAALPQPVQVYIANVGTAAKASVTVTLSITGANTFSDTKTVALPIGAKGIVNFAPLPATLNPGTNTVTVSIPDDDNVANNSVTVSQLVTTNRLSYIEPGKATDGAFSYSNTSAGGVLSTKYTVNGTVVLSDALLTFAKVPSDPTTSYQVVVYDASGTGGAPGNVLFASAAQDRPAAGGDVTVALPGLQVTNAFHIGVKELGTTGLALASQTQSPLKGSTFYYSANGSAPWNDVAATTFAIRLAIEAGLAPAPNCAAPTALAVTGATSTTAVVSFTDAANLGSYQLVYGPIGFQPASSGTSVTATASPFTLTGLQPGTNYQVYARTNCTAGGTSLFTGPAAFSTACNAVTTVATFPYNEGFDNILTGQTLPCGIKIVDANNDGATWAVSKVNPNSGTSSIRYNGLTLNNVTADDWFFTPALTLLGTSRYQVAFRYRGEGIANSPSAYTESLEVKSGTAATAAGQTNLLYTNAAITNTAYALANGTSVPVVAVLPVGASTQYVGFHVKSSANQGILYIDDVSVTATVITGTSEALLRAVTVFPNPSTTGFFDLEIHGANAKGGLDVQVTNTLGQRVYSGSARDNYTNKLDLSGLAPGIYLLKVRTGNEFLTRQVSIVK